MPFAAALAAALLGFAPVAHATPSIIVTPASAPNGWGSPSFATWSANSVQAQYLGLLSYGTPGTPTYYQVAPSVMNVSDNVVTGFPSWQGQADPGVVFGAAFASELGNRLHFGFDLKGNGQLVSIDQLSFSGSSTDAGNTLGFGYAGGYSYSNSCVGLLYGSDGIRGTADDIFVTSGPSTTLVDEIIGRGSGNAWDTYDSDPGATRQDKLDNIRTLWGLGTASFQFTGTYAYGTQATGSATVTFRGSAVPDGASTLTLLGIALASFGCLRRRRHS